MVLGPLVTSMQIVFFHGVLNAGARYSVMKGILRINESFKSALSRPSY